MATSNSWFGVIVLIAAMAFLLPALSHGQAAGATTYNATDQMTVQQGANVSVSESGVRYSEEITVTANNTTLSEGDDYAWNGYSGEVTWLSSASVPDGTTAEVDYQYRQLDDDTSALDGPLSAVAGVFPYAVVLVLLTLILAMVNDSWGT